MGSNIAQQAQNLNVFLGGIGWAGKVKSYTPPPLEETIEDYKNGALNGSIPLVMGQEPMTTEVVFNGHHKEVYTTWGLRNGYETEIKVRGALEDWTGEITPVEFLTTGRVSMVTPDAWLGEGEIPTVTLTQRPHYYKITMGGTDLIEIDVPNVVQKINGIDQLEEIRAAIGL